MAGFIAILKELINDIVSFLRYFAAPLVGGSIAWMADADHNVIQGAPAGFPMLLVAGFPISFWALVPFLAVLGIALYSAHRAVFMPVIGRWIHKRLVASDRGSMEDFSFARWKRRAALAGSVERVAQSVLDQANAATDFLYCSCWATVVLTGLLLGFFPGAMQIGRWRTIGVLGISFSFWLAGFLSHRNTAYLDSVAHDKFS